MTSVMPMRTWLASRAAVVGGVWHVIVALAVLFLPLLETCLGSNCIRYPYWEIGDMLGGVILTLTAILGIMAIATSRIRASARNTIRLSLGVLSATSCIIAYVTAWSIGLALVPGTVLLPTATLLT
jgi:hypothetical protein